MTSDSTPSAVSLDLQTIKITCCKCQHGYNLTGTADLKCGECGHIPDAVCKYESSSQYVTQIGDLDNQLEIIVCKLCGSGQLFKHPWPMHSEKGQPVCGGCGALFGTMCARFVRAPLASSESRASKIAAIEKSKIAMDIPKSRSWNSATCQFCWLGFDRPCAGNKRAFGE